jgi:hypothetical protein
MSTATNQGVIPTTLDRIDADAIESTAEREAVEALRHTADTGCQYSSLFAIRPLLTALEQMVDSTASFLSQATEIGRALDTWELFDHLDDWVIVPVHSDPEVALCLVEQSIEFTLIEQAGGLQIEAGAPPNTASVVCRNGDFVDGADSQADFTALPDLVATALQR